MKTFKLPGVKITLTNENSEHLNYFNNIFYADQYASTPLSINVKFSKFTKSKEFEIVEGKTIRKDKEFFLLDSKNNWVKIDFSKFTSKKIEIEAESQFDLDWLYNMVIEPSLIIFSLRNKYLYFHASAIAKKRKAIIFPAWQQAGKTRLVLENADRFSFISDDFCVIKANTVYGFPKRINLFSYNFEQYPSLFNRINNKSKILIKTGLLLKMFTRMTIANTSKTWAKGFYRLSELLEAITNVKMEPSKIGLKVKRDAKLDSVIFLQNSNKKNSNISKISINEGVRKMSFILKREFSDYYQLYNKFLFLFPNKSNKEIDEFFLNYEKEIKKVLKGKSVNLFLLGRSLKSINEFLLKI